MKVLPFLIKYSPWLLVLSIGTGVISGVASSFMIALVNERVSKIENPAEYTAAIFMAVAFIALMAELSSRLALLRLSTRAVRKMRLALCDQILLSSLRNIERQGGDRLMAALTEDIHRVTEALTQFPVQCINLAIITGCFSYLFYLSWELSLIFLTLFSFGIFIHELIVRRTRPLLEQGRDKWDELISHYNGLIDGNKELKIHAQRRLGFSNEELRPTAQKMMELSWGWNKIFSVAESYGQFIYYALIGIILFVVTQYATYPAEVLTGFVLMLLFMSGPISAIVGSFPVFHSADISMEKIQSLDLSLQKDDERDINDLSEAAHRSIEQFESIELKDFCYEYEHEEGESGFTLGPLNIAFKPGELVFVIGGNGSGKSSFARLFVGLYSQTSGEIIFNGKEVTTETKDAYRQHFSVIFSDYYLFKTLYGIFDDSSYEKAEHYINRLQLQDKVSIIDRQLSTLDLSQGQKKRLALLTAFIEGRDIYLFDEWAADQDPEFKRVFYHEILPELKAQGKTLIVISHDDYYYDVADRVVRFAEGQIVEDYYKDKTTEKTAPVLEKSE
ncbi:cyclic peptide export ABC transporter [Alteromonas sp. a30]|uniref:cyclic peptide export ABC transporter n=1 Tax=Alteromonas sp. a30 TaxID=2730917 RepID=UPI002281C926|nr:cyclic peptide export ABC transporter [Alteromonas sp. a30]MCY7294926.1 cyclic peptide export ABC transporter [Alteromonas sp. a30]